MREGDDARPLLPELLVPALEEGGDEFVLRAEIAIEARFCDPRAFGRGCTALRAQFERETKAVGAVERDADGQRRAVIQQVRTGSERRVEQLRRADDGEERKARDGATARHELQ